MSLRLANLLPWLAVVGISTSDAAVFNATSSVYLLKLAALKAGDTLNLTSGKYPLLNLTDLQGSASAWITIQGPSTGNPAIINVRPANPYCCNLVQLQNNAYLAIKNLTVDSESVDFING